jgi:Tol biopolymer transport system component
LHSFQWSPDSKHYAYVVGARESSPSAFVVLDGQAGDRYAQVNHLRFSPDGRRLAVVARESLRAPGDVLVVDKKKEYSAPAILAPLFSPDGKKVACFTLGKTSSLVINGVVASDVGTLEDIQNSSLVWSADSRHFAYVARSPKEPGKLVLVVDGKQVGEEAGQIGRPIFLGNVLHYISVNLGFGEWGKVDLQ